MATLNPKEVIQNQSYVVLEWQFPEGGLSCIVITYPQITPSQNELSQQNKSSLLHCLPHISGLDQDVSRLSRYQNLYVSFSSISDPLFVPQKNQQFGNYKFGEKTRGNPGMKNPPKTEAFGSGLLNARDPGRGAMGFHYWELTIKGGFHSSRGSLESPLELIPFLFIGV